MCTLLQLDTSSRDSTPLVTMHDPWLAARKAPPPSAPVVMPPEPVPSSLPGAPPTAVMVREPVAKEAKPEKLGVGGEGRKRAGRILKLCVLNAVLTLRRLSCDFHS